MSKKPGVRQKLNKVIDVAGRSLGGQKVVEAGVPGPRSAAARAIASGLSKPKVRPPSPPRRAVQDPESHPGGSYYGSAVGIKITPERAAAEIRKHGLNPDDFFKEAGKKATYDASKVLDWLGY